MSSIGLESVPAIASAILMFIVGFFVLVRYFQNRMRETLCWGSALVFYGFADIIEFAFAASLIIQDSLTNFIRQTFLVFTIILFYCGCTLVMTRRRVFTALSASLFFILQESLIFYLDFVLLDFTLSATVHIIFFGIPFYVFFLVFFLVDYLASRRFGSLLVALAWLSYVIILPLYFLWRETPLLPTWFVLRVATMIPLFLGFVLLAYSKTR